MESQAKVVTILMMLHLFLSSHFTCTSNFLEDIYKVGSRWILNKFEYIYKYLNNKNISIIYEEIIGQIMLNLKVEVHYFTYP